MLLSDNTEISEYVISINVVYRQSYVERNDSKHLKMQLHNINRIFEDEILLSQTIHATSMACD